ncbi:geranylgeranyl reductase family protein [Cellulomonas shaoxiangyii]|uniref:Geranylgeranyl reductase family protein n=1 Tax=Cellulomonas shaoxiangyii TaxID=2566013 RepID=A0A4P7SG15_9CELL|nr:geranylgeranyl reductase family protein [Cellulomonas shaoxiangyii]QCB92850.1 geranylgeranyl reductase family protein [Cellulomonas shaoxiangyii]TGY85503.1 geranylgeranyl reductase family protein [Cellulomonas shaoxiangyii]
MGTAHDDADVIVVGAGPAGASAAYHCAAAGLDVLLLEKASFPRDKICGDGLTPRAVAELVRMGVPVREQDGWIRNKGLRVIGGGHRLELAWPELSVYPSYGLARARTSFDQTLAEHARSAGAKLRERTSVTAPVRDERTGRVVGVRARSVDHDGRRTVDAGDEVTYRAPVVVAADGVSARLATAVGRAKRDDRPMGVAVRTYFRTPRHDDPWMESHLELWDGAPGRSNLMPGYGWIFSLGDGTANVGLGSVSSTAAATKVDYKDLFARWMANAPAEWEFTPENQVAPVRGAALPMGFNRGPLYADGLLLAGDAAGMVSPFNGEGIAYGLQAGRVAGDAIAQGLARGSAAGRESALATYQSRMKDDLGGYYTLGRLFVRLIEHPQVMRLCTRYGLPRPLLMRFVLKLLSDCYEPRGGDVVDRVIAGLARIAPAA